jgi:hypothetical protein
VATAPRALLRGREAFCPLMGPRCLKGRERGAFPPPKGGCLLLTIIGWPFGGSLAAAQYGRTEAEREREKVGATGKYRWFVNGRGGGWGAKRGQISREVHKCVPSFWTIESALRTSRVRRGEVEGVGRMPNRGVPVRARACARECAKGGNAHFSREVFFQRAGIEISLVKGRGRKGVCGAKRREGHIAMGGERAECACIYACNFQRAGVSKEG